MIRLCHRLFLVALFGALIGLLTSCDTTVNEYTIKIKSGLSNVFVVGQEDIDFTQYFIITDQNNKNYTVTVDMLDLSLVDLTKPGIFTVKLTYKKASFTATFTVFEDQSNQLDELEITNSKDLSVDDVLQLHYTTTPSDLDVSVVWSSSDTTVATVSTDGLVTAIKAGTVTITITSGIISKTVSITITNPIAMITDILYQYSNHNNWNFSVQLQEYIDHKLEWEATYSYDGYNARMTYEYDGFIYCDYLIYDEGNDVYYYYRDTGYDDFNIFKEGSDDYNDYYDYFDYLDMTFLEDYAFTDAGSYYEAINPQKVGTAVLGTYAGDTWGYFHLHIANSLITKIEASSVYGYQYILEFSEYNKISIDSDDFIEDEVVEKNDVLSVFTDRNLKVDDSTLAYESSRVADGYDTTRGVQFLQNFGEVRITSVASVSGVRSVTVEVSTNNSAGMEVLVNIGGTYLSCMGVVSVLVPLLTYNKTLSLTFTSDASLDGLVQVTLKPKSKNNSMYMKSVGLTGSPAEIMPGQDYHPSTVDSRRLQDHLADINGGIGLPSIGDYHALVVPVQFSDTTISPNDLEKLRISFNGTSTQTGWESVATYYAKSSFYKLNITFDIQEVYLSTKSSHYYKTYRKTVTFDDGYVGYQTGNELLLLEVLAYLEPRINLSKYDSNDDGIIDAVYLIYSADVDYEGASNVYWAYVTTYVAPESENKTFDDLDAYYYLFAGFDFMDEDTVSGFVYNEKIPGLFINSSTYIHETGHLLGLDDYYDYDNQVGGNEGLGGSDMMDYTVGDHNAYSKMMLGWIEPIIITTSQTIDIARFESSGEFIMLLLDYNGSYFCEYLMIDLYSATGLNVLHASVSHSYLYGGAQFGARIYHVSSDIDNPYSDSYYSLTTYNNSVSKLPLIKLIEADGEKRFSSTSGFAKEKDLWKTGDVFSSKFPTYARNDSMKVNFEITFTSVTSTNAKITISFHE